jgi:hypothetical protein
MGTPMPNKKRPMIVDAAGTGGRFGLQYALACQDFNDCCALAEVPSGQDATVSCMGVYIGADPDAQLREVIVDYPIEFPRVVNLSPSDWKSEAHTKNNRLGATS